MRRRDGGGRRKAAKEEEGAAVAIIDMRRRIRMAKKRHRSGDPIVFAPLAQQMFEVAKRLGREEEAKADGSSDEPDTPASWGEWNPSRAAERPPEPARRMSILSNPAEVASLSPEQRQAAHLIEAGLNVFVTGPGGTGKSFLIDLVRKGAAASGVSIRVTASTGIAALNVQGETLHRFAALGLAERKSIDQVVMDLRASRRGVEDPRIASWLSTDVLIVDEVSMLDAQYLRKLDAAARFARGKYGSEAVRVNSRKPFGGIQLILTGDLAQLTMHDTTIIAETEEWAQWVPFTVVLRTVFRQRSDARFLDMLHRIRLGRAKQRDINAINDRRAAHPEEGADAVELCPLRRTVARINAERMVTASARVASARRFGNMFRVIAMKRKSGGGAAPRRIDDMDEVRRMAQARDARGVASLSATRQISLRASRGRDETFRSVGTSQCMPDGSASQWSAAAATGIFDMGSGARFADAREESQTVQGLHERVSAVRACSDIAIPKEDVILQRLVDTAIVEMNLEPEVVLCVGATVLVTRNVDQDAGIVNGTLGVVVGFTCDDGDEAAPVAGSDEPAVPFRRREASGSPVIEVFRDHSLWAIRPHAVRTPAFETTNDRIFLEVESLPLLCAWAITVHRAQGMTLDNLRIHTEGIRRPALLYTSLSRARSLEGVCIVGVVEADMAMANPAAIRYYDAIELLLKHQSPDLQVVLSDQVKELMCCGEEEEEDACEDI